MPTMTVTQGVTTPTGTFTDSKAYTSGSYLGISEAVDDGATNQEITCTIDFSEIKAFYIKADQDMTFEANDSTTGVPTIELLAGVPYISTEDSYFIDLLTVDITTIFLTNASGSDGTFELHVITDPTP